MKVDAVWHAFARAGSRVRMSPANTFRLFLAAFGAVLTAALAPAQETPAFRSTTRLVEVSVVATAKDGTAVADLQPSDFVLMDGSRRREIAVFRFEGSHGDLPKQPEKQLPPFVFTNRLQEEIGPSRNITAILLDSANTTPSDQMFVKAQALRLLQALEPQTPVAVYQLSQGLQIVHDFTDDREELRDLLQRIHIEFQSQRLSDVERAAREAEEMLSQIEAAKTHYRWPVYRSVDAAARSSISGEVNFNSTVRGNRVETTLSSLEALARHLQGVPGRKSIVWITGGISLFLPRLSTAPGGIPANPMSGDNLEQAVRGAARRLAQSGVALYVLDARGLTSSAESLSERQELPPLAGRYSELERASALSADPRAASSLLASVTGGRFIYGTNDLSAGARWLAGDLHASYTLGFYLPEEPDGKWHPLKVTARRPGVQLLYKEGYLSEPSESASRVWDAEAQRQAMMNALGSNGIRITALCRPAPQGPAGTLSLTLQIEAEDLYWRPDAGRMTGDAEVFIGEKLASGEVRFQQSKIHASLPPAQMEIARARGIPFRREWKPGDGTLSVRVLVRDSSTGRLGTVDIPLSAVTGK